MGGERQAASVRICLAKQLDGSDPSPTSVNLCVFLKCDAVDVFVQLRPWNPTRWHFMAKKRSRAWFNGLARDVRVKFTNLLGGRFACRVPGTYLNEALSSVTPEISHSLWRCAEPSAGPTELCIRILDRAETPEDKHGKALFDVSFFTLPATARTDFWHIYVYVTIPPFLYLTTTYKTFINDALQTVVLFGNFRMSFYK